MSSLFQTILWFLSIIYSCETIEYNGPADIHYFQQQKAVILNATYLQGAIIKPVPTHNKNYFFLNTTSIDPIKYYKFKLPAQSKELCPVHQVTTCCPPYAQEINMYCNGSSLDTVLYLLKEKRDQIVLLETIDDISKRRCTNPEKSIIDLARYDAGIYYIGVGGFAEDNGWLFLYFNCTKYSFPIQESDIKIKADNVQTISCNTILQNQFNTESNLVSYYLVNLNFSLPDIHAPVVISTCDVNNKCDDKCYTNRTNDYCNQLLYDLYPDTHSNDHVLSNLSSWLPLNETNLDPYLDPYCHQYDTYVYLIQNVTKLHAIQHKYTILDQSDYSQTCGDSVIPADIIVNSSNEYTNGEYFIAVQGYGNIKGNFTLNMTCAEPPATPKEISRVVIKWTTISVVTLCVLLFIYFYICQWKIYKKKHLEILHNESYFRADNSDTNDEESDLNDEHNQIIDEKKEKPLDLENEKHENVNLLSPPSMLQKDASSPHEIQMAISEPKLIGKHENIENVTGENGEEDKIQRCIQHAIKCCQDESGLDIYQSIAIRWADEKSWEPYAIEMLKNFGCEVIFIAPLYQAIFVAVIVMLLQTMGITVVVYKLFYSYYGGDLDSWHFQCSMELDRWENVYSLKIVSFLWSLVITICINEVVRTIEHAAIYKSVSELDAKELNKISGACFWFLIRLGQIVNYYACLISVIGSFFIIFATNKGNKMDDGSMDYSESALDMILNAVALFFILELDSFVLQYHDYQDVANFLSTFYEQYSANRDLQVNTSEVETICCNCLKDPQDVQKCIKHCGRLTKCIAFLVKFGLYAVGAVAPILIFVCW